MNVTELDRDTYGVWLVRTQGSVHEWHIDEDGVFYVRNPDPNKSHHWSTAAIAGRALHPTKVHVWPKVGERFHTDLAHMDTPWHLSSEVVSIEKVEM
jgi:hypothetical protein